MNQTDVPQDEAILEQWHEITYAVNEAGNYVLIPSSGWDTSNVANYQAWQLIAEEIIAALREIRRGTASPLLVHMVRNQMDIGLLASYVGLSRWRVRRHLRACHYRKLSVKLRKRYADLFRIPLAALDLIPEQVEVPTELAIKTEEDY